MSVECKICGAFVDEKILKKNKYICPECSGYYRVGARDRIAMLADKGTFHELFAGTQGANPLNTDGYEQKIRETRGKTGLDGRRADAGRHYIPHADGKDRGSNQETWGGGFFLQYNPHEPYHWRNDCELRHAG